MTTEDRLIQIAENTHKVYEKGYVDGDIDGYDAGYLNGILDGAEQGAEQASIGFWNAFTANGKRETYLRAFNETDFSKFGEPPIGLIKATKASNHMFYNYSFTGVLPKNIDLSGVSRGTSVDSSTGYNLFGWCNKVVEIYDMGLPTQFTYHSAFQYCRKLEK